MKHTQQNKINRKYLPEFVTDEFLWREQAVRIIETIDFEELKKLFVFSKTLDRIWFENEQAEVFETTLNTY